MVINHSRVDARKNFFSERVAGAWNSFSLSHNTVDFFDYENLKIPCPWSIQNNLPIYTSFLYFVMCQVVVFLWHYINQMKAAVLCLLFTLAVLTYNCQHSLLLVSFVHLYNESMFLLFNFSRCYNMSETCGSFRPMIYYIKIILYFNSRFVIWHRCRPVLFLLSVVLFSLLRCLIIQPFEAARVF